MSDRVNKTGDRAEKMAGFYRVTRRQIFRWKKEFKAAGVIFCGEDPVELARRWPGGDVPRGVKDAILRFAAGERLDAVEGMAETGKKEPAAATETVPAVPFVASENFRFADGVEAARLQVDYWAQKAKDARGKNNDGEVQAAGRQLELANEALRKVMLSEAKISSLAGDTISRSAVVAGVRHYNEVIKKGLIQGITDYLKRHFPGMPNLREQVMAAYDAAAGALRETEFADE